MLPEEVVVLEDELAVPLRQPLLRLSHLNWPMGVREGPLLDVLGIGGHGAAGEGGDEGEGEEAHVGEAVWPVGGLVAGLRGGGRGALIHLLYGARGGLQVKVGAGQGLLGSALGGA